MTPPPAITCAHEIRPGTAVCLYCRAEARSAQRARRQRMLMKSLGIGGGIVAVAAVVLMAASVLRRSDGTASAAAAKASDSSSTLAAAAPAGSPAGTGAPDVTQPAPEVAPGRTALGNGIFAERRGNAVLVNFDTRETRTRRSDKFEKVVRATLPSVLGSVGTAALERVEQGALVPAGSLLAAAEQGPLLLPVGDGRVVRLTPLTRMGEDGPLVVTYQASIEPAATPPAT